MAEFTDQDRELLDFLRKEFAGASRTSSTRKDWQELMARRVLVDTTSVMGTSAVSGLVGSWAAAFSYGDVGASTTSRVPSVPSQTKIKTSHLGQRGLPDVDFVPYNVRTNRFGSKGPSLLGHPISYEIVGPTLKTQACNWTWLVQPGAGPNGGDLLTMDVQADGSVASCTTIQQAYNLANFTLGGAGEPNGGLYLVVSDDGSDPGAIPIATTAMSALPEFVDTTRFELFRVSDVSGSSIEIHPSKSFSKFFSLPANRQIRAITLITPFVTRLAAVPNGNQGRETTFVFVSPERAAASDSYPPFDGGNVQDGTWLQGDFSTLGAPGSQASVGDADSWMGKVSLPIPRPLREGVASVDSGAAVTTSTDIGLWKLSTGDIGVSDIGRIIHIFNVLESDVPPFRFGDVDACLGWYEIVDVIPGPPNDVFVRRVAEIDPSSGVVYYGPGPYVRVSVGPEEVLVYYTIHDPVTKLWQGNFDLDAVDACRLKNIIDPRMVKKTQKVAAANVSPPKRALGSSLSRPDRAVFPTRKAGGFVGLPTIDDPGNLMDLGFRVVLFPAKSGTGGVPIPDFDHPITSLETVIDPSISDSQFLTLDYAAGILTLSHLPPSVAGGDIIPNGIIIHPTMNPRGEVILYAACVPFSTESGQLGGGVRVTAKKLGDAREIDAFSQPVQAFIDQSNTNLAISAPFFGPSTIAPNPVEIVLDRIWEGPETGVVEIVEGLREDSLSYGLWGYSSRRSVIVGSNRVTALGGISCLLTAIDPSTPLGANPSRSVVLRRDVVFSQRSLDISNVFDTYQEDTTYGSSKRNTLVRIEGASQTVLPDGSVQVTLQPRNQLWQQYGVWSAANKDVGGFIEIGSDGLLQGPVYFDAGVAVPNGVGTLSNSLEGQNYVLGILPVVGENKAIVSNDVLIQPQHRFRLVIKFETRSFGGATDTVTFLGLVGNTVPGVNVTALAAPFDVTKAYMGLRHVGDLENPVDQWHLFLNAPGGSSNTINLNLKQDEPYYFVMETSQDAQESSGVMPYRLKAGVFTKDMVPVYEGEFKTGESFLPAPDVFLNLYFGFKFDSGGSRRNLRLYYSTLVNRIDLKGPEL